MILSKRQLIQNFPGGPVVTNPPCRAENSGSIPGGGAEILQAAEQRCPCAATLSLPASSGAGAPQLESSYVATKDPI